MGLPEPNYFSGEITALSCFLGALLQCRCLGSVSLILTLSVAYKCCIQASVDVILGTILTFISFTQLGIFQLIAPQRSPVWLTEVKFCKARYASLCRILHRLVQFCDFWAFNIVIKPGTEIIFAHRSAKYIADLQLVSCCVQVHRMSYNYTDVRSSNDDATLQLYRCYCCFLKHLRSTQPSAAAAAGWCDDDVHKEVVTTHSRSWPGVADSRSSTSCGGV